MDKTSLVEENKINGKKLIESLDRTKFKVKASLWFYLVDSNEWRLIIASPFVDKHSMKDAYSFVREELIELSIHSDLGLKDISIVSPKHKLINLLKGAIQTGSEEISGIRFTSNVINSVLIDDAYIYRMQ